MIKVDLILDSRNLLKLRSIMKPSLWHRNQYARMPPLIASKKIVLLTKTLQENLNFAIRKVKSVYTVTRNFQKNLAF